MAFDVKIPATSKSFYKAADKPGLVTIINRIKGSDYYNYIQKYSEEQKIPADLLISVIASESEGRNVGKNGFGAIGLMQMKWGTAYDTIKKEAMNKTLTDEDKAVIKAKVPTLASKDFKVQYGDFVGMTGATKTKVIKELESALTNPQFNVLMGAMHIGHMVDKFTSMTGKVMLHQALAIYNQGIGRTSLVRPYSSVDDMLNKSKIASEAKAYVLKIMGTNGYLDLLTA